jgi:uncharacterized RDD family membrane protein YckC
MKCPKCRYLSFEPELRCKHCGFDFSMADHLPLHRFDELEQQDPDVPMVDLQLRSVERDIDTDDRPVRRSTVASTVAVAERVAPPARAAVQPVPRHVPAPTPNLPLFIKGVPAPVTAEIPDTEEREDVTMRVPAAPRPLAVRRRTAEEPRPSAPAAPVVRPMSTRSTSPTANRMPIPPAASGDVDAPARLKAACLDLAVLAGLNIAVVLLTLRQCDLTIAQIASVPIIPMTGFLVAITVGYLLSFNVVSRQTIGKMVFGLRVVGDEDLAPTPRQMSYRALLTVPSILLFGLGFLPGLVGEGRAVHDRLTHTRVVRV